MLRKSLRLDLVISAVLVLGSCPAWGSAERRELFMRSGVVAGRFQGKDVADGKFVTDVNLQAEFWLYQSPQESWNFQFLVANESGIGRSRYFGAGIGQRFFIKSEGFIIEQKINGDFYKFIPNYAYYVGWDANLVQFLVLPFGDVLSSYTTTMEGGGVVGLRKPLSSQFSLDVTAGLFFGYSFSSTVTVTTNILRVFGGLGFSF